MSELAFEVFNGNKEKLTSALTNGIDWKNEPDLLTAAVWASQLELARMLIKAGHPIDESTYSLVYYYGNQILLKDLPLRDDLLNQFKQKEHWDQLLRAILAEDVELVVKLCEKLGSDLNNFSDLLADHVQRAPLHLAARKASYELIVLLIEKGADINLLDGEGKSPLRLVAECSSASNNERRKCIRFLKERGGVFTPEIKGWLTRWQVNRGTWYPG